FSHGTLIAAGGPPMPWSEVPRPFDGRTDGRTDGPSILRLPGGGLFLGSAVPLASTPDATAMAALALDAAFARQIAGQVGLPVAILDGDAGDPGDPRLPLRAEVLATGRSGSGHLKAAGLYVSIRPLRAPSGEVAALVETSLPRGAVAASLARLS